MMRIFKNSQLTEKKRRARVACLTCRERKVRCNVEGGIPCYNCKADKVSCSIAQRKRPKPRQRSNQARKEFDLAGSHTASPDYSSVIADLLPCDSPFSEHCLETPDASTFASTSPSPRCQKQTSSDSDHRYIGNIIRDNTRAPTPSPSLSIGCSCQTSRDERISSELHEDVQRLLRICTELTALTCKLATSALASSSITRNTVRHTDSLRLSSEVDCLRTCIDCVPTELDNSPDLWNDIDNKLPDELGLPGFDFTMDVLNSEIE